MPFRPSASWKKKTISFRAFNPRKNPSPVTVEPKSGSPVAITRSVTGSGPVKMPRGPESRNPRNATVPRSLMAGDRNALKGPEASTIFCSPVPSCLMTKDGPGAGGVFIGQESDLRPVVDRRSGVEFIKPGALVGDHRGGRAAAVDRSEKKPFDNRVEARGEDHGPGGVERRAIAEIGERAGVVRHHGRRAVAGAGVDAAPPGIEGIQLGGEHGGAVVTEKRIGGHEPAERAGLRRGLGDDDEILRARAFVDFHSRAVSRRETTSPALLIDGPPVPPSDKKTGVAPGLIL